MARQETKEIKLEFGQITIGVIAGIILFKLVEIIF